MKRIHIHLEEKQLIYDIGNIAYVSGEVMDTSDESKRSWVIDVTQDGNIDLVHRWLEIAVNEVKKILHAYLSDPVEPHSLEDDKLVEKHNYCFWLKVPDTFPDISHRLIALYAHDYLVNYVLFEWLSLTGAGSVRNIDVYLAKLKELESSIRNASSSRTGAILRGSSMF